MDGHEATTAIRKFEKTLTGKPAPGHRVNGRIPIIAVSASLQESEKSSLAANFDGWILKPINFSRMLEVLAGITNEEQREQDAYVRGQWERGGWLIGESLSLAREQAGHGSPMTDLATPIFCHFFKAAPDMVLANGINHDKRNRHEP